MIAPDAPADCQVADAAGWRLAIGRHGGHWWVPPGDGMAARLTPPEAQAVVDEYATDYAETLSIVCP